MPRSKHLIPIIVAVAVSGWFIHHRSSAKPALAEQIRSTQHLVDWLAFVGFADWRNAHHAGCDDTLIAFRRVMTVPRDAWNRGLWSVCSGSRVTVTSAGPDGVFGTADDIASD